MTVASVKWHEGDSVVAGVRLHYRRGGRGTPVLLLHGITDSGSCWGRTADALAQSHDVILLDQRAHGLSDAPQEDYHLTAFANDAAGVLRDLGTVPAAVLGHSLGARVGLTLAATQPDLVSRLVLDDPPLRTGSARRDAEVDADDRRDRFTWIQELQKLSRDELIARCRTQSPAWSAEECACWADSKLQVRAVLLESVDLDTDWRWELAQVQCPVLLIGGDPALGSMIDDALADEAQPLMRSGLVVQIAGAGHSVHRDQFEPFIHAVAPFLEGQPSR